PVFALQSLLDDSEVTYQMSYPYVPEAARGVGWGRSDVCDPLVRTARRAGGSSPIATARMRTSAPSSGGRGGRSPAPAANPGALASGRDGLRRRRARRPR